MSVTFDYGDLDYLASKAVEWFNDKQCYSCDWKLGRMAILRYHNNNINYLNCRDLRNSVVSYIEKSINNNSLDNEQCKIFIECLKNLLESHDTDDDDERDLENIAKDILLFLISWNISKFIQQCTNNNCNNHSFVEHLKNWVKALKEILRCYYSYSEHSDAESIYKNLFLEIFCIYKQYIGEEERVITAKTLSLLNPDKFIAWDNQIVNRLFGIDLKSYRGNSACLFLFYKKFNEVAGKFIEYVNSSGCAVVKYDRKLLDMILYLGANDKLRDNDDIRFITYFDKVINKMKEMY